MEEKRAKPSVGERRVERLTEFAEALENGEDLSDRFTCRRVVLDLDSTPYDPELVKNTRGLLRASQGVFAQFLGVSVRTVQAWETGAHTPNAITCRLMDAIRD